MTCDKLIYLSEPRFLYEVMSHFHFKTLAWLPSSLCITAIGLPLPWGHRIRPAPRSVPSHIWPLKLQGCPLLAILPLHAHSSLRVCTSCPFCLELSSKLPRDSLPHFPRSPLQGYLLRKSPQFCHSQSQWFSSLGGHPNHPRTLVKLERPRPTPLHHCGKELRQCNDMGQVWEVLGKLNPHFWHGPDIPLVGIRPRGWCHSLLSF